MKLLVDNQLEDSFFSFSFGIFFLYW